MTKLIELGCVSEETKAVKRVNVHTDGQFVVCDGVLTARGTINTAIAY